MPFWRERTAVSGPTMGRMRSAAVSVSNDFTQKRMTSAAERPRTSSTAARRTTDSPSTEERMRRPSRWIAVRCSPRAISVTVSPGRSGRRWIIDPLDGTTNYAHGLPIFGVSIGLEADRQMQVGVVFDPNRDELFVAERGRGATVNDQPLAVSPTAMLGESLVATGFPYNVRETADNNLREYAAFTVRTRGVRRMGSAVLYLAWLAAGRLDGYW